jgi:hypothetical protein
MMHEVYFIEFTKQGYGRSREDLVAGAIDTDRVVAVQSGGFHSRFDSTVQVLTDDGREFTVKGTVKDWIRMMTEEPSDTE